MNIFDRNEVDDDRRFGVISRVAIMFVAVTLIWQFIIGINNIVFGTDYSHTGHVVNAVLATALAVPAVILARRLLDNRPVEGLGLSSIRIGWRSFLIGMGCYLIPASFAWVGALALGWIEISLETSLLDIGTIFLGLLLLVFLYEALPEELVFRGYIYRNLSTIFPRWGAVVGQAVLFGMWGAGLWMVTAGVSQGIERLGLFFFIALIIGMIRAITDDIWACIGFHLAFQTVEQLFGGTWADGVFAVSASGSVGTCLPRSLNSRFSVSP